MMRHARPRADRLALRRRARRQRLGSARSTGSAKSRARAARGSSSAAPAPAPHGSEPRARVGSRSAAARAARSARSAAPSGTTVTAPRRWPTCAGRSRSRCGSPSCASSRCACDLSEGVIIADGEGHVLAADAPARERLAGATEIPLADLSRCAVRAAGRRASAHPLQRGPELAARAGVRRAHRRPAPRRGAPRRRARRALRSHGRRDPAGRAPDGRRDDRTALGARSGSRSPPRATSSAPCSRRRARTARASWSRCSRTFPAYCAA